MSKQIRADHWRVKVRSGVSISLPNRQAAGMTETVERRKLIPSLDVLKLSAHGTLDVLAMKSLYSVSQPVQVSRYRITDHGKERMAELKRTSGEMPAAERHSA